MNIEERKNRTLILVSIILMIIILVGGSCLIWPTVFKTTREQPTPTRKATQTTDYNIQLIKEINKTSKNNYLVSPYSIEIALNMLREGTDGETREQIEKLIGNRDINYFKTDNKINMANGVFVNEQYKNNVLKSYYKTLRNKYNSDIIYDKFENPKAVNEWVNRKTNGMIPSTLNRLNQEDLLVLVNALAIDVEWKSGFECDRTYSEEFTKLDGSKYAVSMMHQTYSSDVKYFEDKDAKGVIIPYKAYDKEENQLEFIGILPNDNANKYVSELTEEKLDNLYKIAKKATYAKEVVLSLPSFKYDYEVSNLIGNLKNLGIKNVFMEGGADLSKMIDIPSHVSQVIHKAHIELEEKGTKAAAVTAIVVTKDTAVIDETENFEIEFNKPFVYMIRDEKTKEMLFFGVVYEPNKWNGSTCTK